MKGIYMIQERSLARAVRLMCVGMAAGTLAMPAFAQDAAQAPMQRVEITGSSIKRIAQEGSLPVQTLTQEDIKRTGATSATELIQNLPAMQGFVPASSSVNGGGAGATTAALHSLQSKYTLVLLDGQRMAPVAMGSSQGSGYAVNISSIPLEAVERVEILTDGASALYGSDAIAGVVNFILKKNKTDASVFATIQKPQEKGGESWSAGITKGFGNLDTDKFNILFSYSHDEQKELHASQREFSKVGAFFPFSYKGTNYIFDQRTGNTEPANINLQARPANNPAAAATAYSLNPYHAANGNCGGPLAGPQFNIGATGVSCRFNYAATVQNIPATKRDSVLLKGTHQLNDTTQVWGELVLSRFEMTAMYAPSAQPLGVNATTRFPTLWNRYVQPFLTANNLTASSATLGYRSVMVGGRTDDYVTDARHFATGISGEVANWRYNASATLSHTQIRDVAAGGYTDFDKLTALVASNQYDPVVGTGADLLKPALLNGTEFSRTKSSVNSYKFGAQRDMWELPGGASIISVGADVAQTRYRTKFHPLILSQSGFSTQPASVNYPVGGNYGQVPFDAERDSRGAFAEVLLPLHKTFETTLAARYDQYDRVHSRYVFDAQADANGVNQQLKNADLGNDFNSNTYKVSFRWTPAQSVLVRGGYGTGFKAPNLNDIAGALTFGGSTAGSYSCPFPGSPGCLPGSAQYDLLSGPNGLSGANGLKPEKSKQWTFGGRFDPITGLSLGMDIWNVQIKDQVLSAGIPENVGFANPQQYASLFVNPYADPAGFTTIGYMLLPRNGGEANYRGIDWDFTYRMRNTGYGNLSINWTGTRMLDQDYTTEAGGAIQTDLGKFGPDNAVVFKLQSHLTFTLDTGRWTNTLSGHYKSGYKDQPFSAGTSVFLATAGGAAGASVAFEGLDVPSYMTWDWQAKWKYNDATTLTMGIKNLFDRNPPLSLQNAGGGNQIGYDGRYADPLGRAAYITLGYKF
jgi:iron complex outermembrane receptor protein